MPKSVPSYPLKHIVEVFWVDSAGRSRWDTLEAYKKERPALCKTCGYLLESTKSHVSVALSQGDSTTLRSTVLDAIVIPRGCVTKIRRLT